MKLFIGILLVCSVVFAPLAFAQEATQPAAKNYGQQVKKLQMEKKAKKKALKKETKMKQKALKMEAKAGKMKLKAETMMKKGELLSGQTATSTPGSLGEKMKALEMERKEKMKALQEQTKAKRETLREETKEKREALKEEFQMKKEELQKPSEATSTPQTPATPPQQGSATTTSTTPTPSEVMVTYSGSAFSPASVTVKLGTKVKFVNQGSGGMWVASAMHPTHQVYPEFDQKSTGNEYSFEFTKVGSWGYHNHVNPGHFGTVVVE